jgi:plasmid stability protein
VELEISCPACLAGESHRSKGPKARPKRRAIRPVFVLAFCCHHLHNACMSVQITIRDVPEQVRDELAARAALRHQSMQEYLRAELERLASKPSVESWLNAVTERKQAAGTRVKTATILRARDADRK